jgi:hypothetical protein
MAGSRLAQVYIGDDTVTPGAAQGDCVLSGSVNIVSATAGADAVTLPSDFPVGTPIVVRNHDLASAASEAAAYAERTEQARVEKLTAAQKAFEEKATAEQVEKARVAKEEAAQERAAKGLPPLAEAPEVEAQVIEPAVPLNIFPALGHTIFPCGGVGVVDAPDVLAANECTTFYSMGNGDFTAA